MTEPTLVETLGRFVAATPSEAIPDGTRARAVVSLLHNLVVARAGRGRYPAAELVARRFHAQPAIATLLACGSKVEPAAAAMANGALFHARSQDDTHPGSTSHPGAPVMAAALAVAEETGASGRDVLDAVILGYEVLGRVGSDIHEALTGRGFRAAAVLGGFGAAAASARLMGLDAAQTAHALAFAAHGAGGLSQVWIEGSAEYPMQLGQGARHGVEAARLASCGMTAARAILEGSRGFDLAYAGGAAAPRRILSGLGVDWQMDAATVKPFPACAILQGPLEALRDGLAPGERVQQIALHLPPFEAAYPGIDNPGPVWPSPGATKMSAQFCLGVMALDGPDDLQRAFEGTGGCDWPICRGWTIRRSLRWPGGLRCGPIPRWRRGCAASRSHWMAATRGCCASRERQGSPMLPGSGALPWIWPRTWP